MVKILKNTTLSDISLEILGITIPASGQFELNTEDYIEAANEESISELTTLINSGDIVINDGFVDLKPQEGIEQVSIFTFRDYKDRFVINQPSHGFTLPSIGVLPVYYNNVASEYQLAISDSINTGADAMIVEIIDSNNFVIQEGGSIASPAHGLVVGNWYVLSSTVAGELVNYATLSGNNVNVQYLIFVSDVDNLIIRMEPIYTRDFFIPQDISILEDWIQGSMPTLTAGTDRILLAGVVWEDNTGTLVSDMSIGGESGTLVVEQSIISGFQQATSIYYWTDSQIDLMINNTLTVTWSSGTPIDFQEFGAILEYVDQTTPFNAINTDSGTGSPDIMDADVNTISGGYAIAVGGSGNSGVTFNNNGTGWTRKLNLTISSADGVVDDKLISSDATPENVNFTLIGSNRHTLVAAAFQRRET